MNNKFLNNAKFEQNINSCSPRSNNFVQKLVASLEKKQKEFGSVNNIASLDKSYKEFCRDEKNGFAAIRRYRLMQRQESDGRILVQRNNSMTIQRFHSDPISLRVLPSRHRLLEDVYEEDQSDRSNDDYISSSETDDSASNFWDSNASITANNKHNKLITNSTLVGNKTTTVVRKAIKNVFSSIKNWNIVNLKTKSLPKGIRDYYATRESLGEEMRVFRKNTMSKLIDNATGKLDTSRGERTKKAREEFSKIIGSEQIADDLHCATIRPVYGNNNFGNENGQDYQFSTLRRKKVEDESMIQLRQKVRESPSSLDVYQNQFTNMLTCKTMEDECVQVRSNKVHERPVDLYQNQFSTLAGKKVEDEIVQLRNKINERSVDIYAIRRSQPPPAPMRSESLPRSVSISSVEEQPLLRPSKVRDLQKRLSTEINMVTNAAVGFKPTTTSRPASIVYDVPRSMTAPTGITMRRSATVNANSLQQYLNTMNQHDYKYPRSYNAAKIAVNLPPEYENVSSRIINGDKVNCRRLYAKFTSF